MTDRALTEALAESQRLGMLGGRPIGEVIAHAGAFVDALAGTHGTVVDLGSGGGVPGLVIAWARPDLRLVLVDRRTTRADHLCRLVNRLGAADRIEVVAADAAALPRLIDLPVDAVVARGLGPPTQTLRLAAPLLARDGLLVVSEPPDPPRDRWPKSAVEAAGLRAIGYGDRRVACFRRADVSRETGG
jgi:16S rRNA (guanine527-N7)-methyltransferase